MANKDAEFLISLTCFVKVKTLWDQTNQAFSIGDLQLEVSYLHIESHIMLSTQSISSIILYYLFLGRVKARGASIVQDSK